MPQIFKTVSTVGFGRSVLLTVVAISCFAIVVISYYAVQRVFAIKKDEEERRRAHKEAMEQRVAELERQKIAAAASGQEEVSRFDLKTMSFCLGKEIYTLHPIQYTPYPTPLHPTS
jgi:hypothetical protein